jgi:hypothetical protein
VTGKKLASSKMTEQRLAVVNAPPDFDLDIHPICTPTINDPT